MLDQRAQRRIVARWLLGQYVQRRPGKLPRVPRRQQRRLVHDAPARAVDNARTWLELGQLTRAEQPARPAGQRRMDRQEIGLGQQLLERQQFDIELARGLW